MLGLEQRVRVLGLVPKRDQIEIMKKACAVLQPTRFEGGPGGAPFTMRFRWMCRPLSRICRSIAKLKKVPSSFFRRETPGRCAKKWSGAWGRTMSEPLGPA